MPVKRILEIRIKPNSTKNGKAIKRKYQACNFVSKNAIFI